MERRGGLAVPGTSIFGPMPPAPPMPPGFSGGSATAARVPFHRILYNRDTGISGIWIEQTDVFYDVIRLAAPGQGSVVVTAISFIPDQVEALPDLVINVTVQGTPVPDFGTRYGMIGSYRHPELVEITIPPGQVLVVQAKVTQTYRSLGATDHRINFICDLIGYTVGRS